MSTDIKTRKPKKFSETRTLPGSVSLKKLAENVITNISSVQVFNERVEKIQLALGVSEKDAREMLKPTEGLADTFKLRKYIRLSLMRSEIATNAIVLARIANFMVNEISEGDETIKRENLKTQNEVDVSI